MENIDETKNTEEKIKGLEWPALESNPDILTNYMQKLGMSEEWIIEDVFSLDKDMIEALNNDNHNGDEM